MALSISSCLEFAPASLCSHGTCVNSTCICDAGYTGLADLVDHEGFDCATSTDGATLSILWGLAAAMGLLCFMGGVYKLRKHIHASSVPVKPQPQTHGSPHHGYGHHHQHHIVGGNKVVMVGSTPGSAMSQPLSGLNGTAGVPLPLRSPNGAAATHANNGATAATPHATLPVTASTAAARALSPVGGGHHILAINTQVQNSPPKQTRPSPMSQSQPSNASTNSGTNNKRHTGGGSGAIITPTAAAAGNGMSAHDVSSEGMTTRPGSTGPIVGNNNGNGGREGAYMVRVAPAPTVPVPLPTAATPPPQQHPHLLVASPSRPPLPTLDTGTPTNGNTTGASGAITAPTGTTPMGSVANGNGGVIETKDMIKEQIKKEDALVADEVAAMGTTATSLLLAVPTARNYRAWIYKSSRVLAFRLSLLLTIEGICIMLIGLTRAVNPDRAIGHHYDQSVLFTLCAYCISTLISDFCVAWCNVYNALASFMPAAGVKPTRYGRQMFLIGYGFILLAGTMPIIINIMMTNVSASTIEAMALFMWLLFTISVTFIIVNFIMLGRHLLSLLHSHLASMSKAEGLLNGRPAGTAMSGTTSAAVRQRTQELQHSINRVTWIIRTLMFGGASSGPVYLCAGLWPWLRGRMAYFLPMWILFLSPITVAIPFTLKYTIKSVNAVGGVAMQQQQQRQQGGDPHHHHHPTLPPPVFPLPSGPPQLALTLSGSGGNNAKKATVNGNGDGTPTNANNGWMVRSTSTPSPKGVTGLTAVPMTTHTTSSSSVDGGTGVNGTATATTAAAPSARVPPGHSMAIQRLRASSSRQLLSPSQGNNGGTGINGDITTVSETTPGSVARRLQIGGGGVTGLMMPGSMATVGEEDGLVNNATSTTSPPMTAHQAANLTEVDTTRSHHPTQTATATAIGTINTQTNVTGTPILSSMIDDGGNISDGGSSGQVSVITAATGRRPYATTDSTTARRGSLVIEPNRMALMDDDEFNGPLEHQLPVFSAVSESMTLRTLSPNAVAMAALLSQPQPPSASTSPAAPTHRLEPINVDAHRGSADHGPLTAGASSASANGSGTGSGVNSAHLLHASGAHTLRASHAMKLALPHDLPGSPSSTLQSISHTQRSGVSDRSMQPSPAPPHSAHKDSKDGHTHNGGVPSPQLSLTGSHANNNSPGQTVNTLTPIAPPPVIDDATAAVSVPLLPLSHSTASLSINNNNNTGNNTTTITLSHSSATANGSGPTTPTPPFAPAVTVPPIPVPIATAVATAVPVSSPAVLPSLTSVPSLSSTSSVGSNVVGVAPHHAAALPPIIGHTHTSFGVFGRVRGSSTSMLLAAGDTTAATAAIALAAAAAAAANNSNNTTPTTGASSSSLPHHGSNGPMTTANRMNAATPPPMINPHTGMIVNRTNSGNNTNGHHDSAGSMVAGVLLMSATVVPPSSAGGGQGSGTVSGRVSPMIHHHDSASVTPRLAGPQIVHESVDHTPR